MLGRLLFLSILFSIVLANFQQLQVPNLLPQAVQPNVAAAAKPCNDVTFNFCQASFDDAIGISNTLNYMSGSNFATAIYNKLSANIQDLLKVCTQGKNFYLCMRSQYDDCINPWNLIRKGATFRNASDYVTVLTQLDFMCNGGFEEVVNQYSCLLTASSSPAYKQCDKTFSSALTADPANLCKYLDQFMSCSKTAFSAQCQSEAAGWWICEDLRLSVGYGACPALRCT